MKDVIQRRIERLEAFIKTVDDANALPHQAAELMHAMVLATGAKRGVEVGTSYGYSGLWLASALAENHGRLITIDRDPRKLQAARSHFEQARLADVIETMQGEAVDLLATLKAPIDFVLLDADKDNCRVYVELIHDKLSERAMILIDNTTTHAEELADFLKWIRHNNDFYCASLAMGNGMEVAVKWPSAKRSQGVFGF